jgi:4-aminobutyrate aminotransferase
MGDRLRAGVEYASEECGVVRDVRGQGLMLGVEFASHDEANAVELAAFERGLLVLECGEASIRFCPPLMVDESAVDTAIRLYAEALASVGCPIRPRPGMQETGG